MSLVYNITFLNKQDNRKKITLAKNSFCKKTRSKISLTRISAISSILLQYGVIKMRYTFVLELKTIILGITIKNNS